MKSIICLCCGKIVSQNYYDHKMNHKRWQERVLWIVLCNNIWNPILYQSVVITLTYTHHGERLSSSPRHPDAKMEVVVRVMSSAALFLFHLLACQRYEEDVLINQYSLIFNFLLSEANDLCWFLTRVKLCQLMFREKLYVSLVPSFFF